MSELINTRGNEANFRKRLLSTACCAAIVTVISAEAAEADGVNRPTVWIELGAQVERMGSVQQSFEPPFVDNLEALGFASVSSVQRPPRYAIGGEGGITFSPSGSDWVFSANIRYGRANGAEARSQAFATSVVKQKKLGGVVVYTNIFPAPHLNASSEDRESHAVLDFQAGKDVGLGLFGSSTVSFGVRFAQFSSRRNDAFNGDHGRHQFGTDFKYTIIQTNHRYYGSAEAAQSFHGIGPSLSIAASTHLFGHRDESEVTFDWGLNGAVLFGRQKIEGDVNATGIQYKTGLGQKAPHYNRPFSSYRNHPAPLDRARSVTVPNLGAFAGFSFNYAAAKVSLGYRADFFFSAMDGGLDARKTYDRNFYGPFATISIGLGG
ncbi:MAG TPA: hypothetical protein VHD95_12795 [Rhizomicrobium sp.]|nr:hypothetical protein [Rhizomicrobium sp.]